MKNRNFLLTIVLSLVMFVGFGNLAKGQCPCGPGITCTFQICIVNTTCDTLNWWFTTTCCGDVMINLPPNIPFCGGCIAGNDVCPNGSCITGIDFNATLGVGGIVNTPGGGPWDWPSYGNTLGGYVGYTPVCTQCVGTGITVTWTSPYPGTPTGAYVITCDHI